MTRKNNSLNICAAALAMLAATGLAIGAEQPAMQAGVHVEMAVTNRAAALPEANAPEAVVVAITADGGEYVGVRKSSEAELAGRLKAALAAQSGKRVYIKADARAGYGVVQRAFESARSAGAGAVFLLTDQPAPAGHANPLPPMGIKLHTKPANGAAVVQAPDRTQPRAVRVDGKDIGVEDLAAAIRRMAQEHGARPVRLEANVEIAFQDVARIVDACREAGAEVYLATTRR
jgi:biopolymer transport protein ExbD